MMSTYLNPVIGAVGNYDGIIRANGDAARPRETSGFAPPLPYLELLPPLRKVLTPRRGTDRCEA